MSRYLISVAAGLVAGAIVYHWRDFPLQFATVIGMMMAFFAFHLMQAIDRLRKIYRKEEW